ncbi:MAG: redox-sensing transcriptional repressor Rex, partial [Bacteroidetes bacterium]|nr:redox-sensing transcriptional repressor Rex [Bacteroidota bacterium]
MEFSGKHKLNKQVSEPTLRRLPVYLYFLEKVREEGTINIS